MLESFGRMVERILGQTGRKRVSLGNVVARAVKQCLETLRLVVLFFFLTTFAIFFFFTFKYLFNHFVHMISLTKGTKLSELAIYL